ncbi:MAG TPA: hypothetical protein VJJ54_04400 [Gemmatimonadales bacterium]|nr:hypothetical protein [Gemmatimonadales bacterium]
MAGSRVKKARSKGSQASKRTTLLSSPKAAEIVSLVEELSAGLGTRDGVELGRPLARMLADAYNARGRPIPAWVEQLTAYFGRSK